VTILLAWLFVACAAGPDPMRPSDTAAGDEARPDPVHPAEMAPGDEGEQNGQPGSIGQAECLKDSECALGNEAAGAPRGRAALTGASCSHALGTLALPTCECRVLVTPNADRGGGIESEPYEAELYAGNRPDRCSEFARGPGCLYCEREFSGCDIADPTSCDAVCADMAQRFDQELARTYAVSTRAARCDPNSYSCQVVSEIDGQCYARTFGAPEPLPLDCSLPDEELLAQSDAIGTSTSCSPRPRVSCSSSEQCPRGLACSDGACASCERSCTVGSGADSCEGGGACAVGEVCASGTCVPSSNAECQSFVDCPADVTCALTGISASGRGNEATHSFCKPSPRARR
jgi:hypothetical protein